jgi:hypothetical protein
MAASKRFEMRIDPDDRARWEEYARRDSRTLARWLTVVANGHIKQVEAVAAQRKTARRAKGIRTLEALEADRKTSRGPRR